MVTLNLDAGELDSETEALWSRFDVLHCACGGHAGDARSMARVAAFCARTGVGLGAHPAYPDRAHFGRRSLAMSGAALADAVAAQCAALAEVAAAAGVAVRSVKPHGALYHDAARDPAIAEAVVRGAIASLGTQVAIVGPAHGGSGLREAAAAHGVRAVREGFADRGRRADGSLVPRGEPGALIEDPDAAARQAVQLAAEVDTICVHADTPNALAIARAVRAAIDRARAGGERGHGEEDGSQRERDGDAHRHDGGQPGHGGRGRATGDGDAHRHDRQPGHGGRGRATGGASRSSTGAAMPDWVALGDRAIRFRRPPRTAPRAIVRAARAWPGVVDVVVARDDVAVYFAAAPQVDPARFAALAALPDGELEPPRTVELHAVYDGPDLADVARAIGATADEVARIHAERTYVVETMGFAPGFAYLAGLDPRLATLPRRATPRPRVPAGALAIAGGFTAVYPFDSPGGWHLLGRVAERMFTADGALLRLGDRVRFVR